MNLDKPISMMQGDMSGSPIAMVEQHRRRGTLRLIDDLTDIPFREAVVTEYPWGPIPQAQTGYKRLVLCRLINNHTQLTLLPGIDGFYLLVLLEKIPSHQIEGLPQNPVGESNKMKAQREARDRERSKARRETGSKASYTIAFTTTVSDK